LSHDLGQHTLIFAVEKETKKERTMITLIFLLIAYCIRNKYLSENARWYDKVLYYVSCVFLTPLFGPWFYKLLTEGRPADPDEEDSDVYPYIG
jgi:hypothetical protein